MRVELVQPPQGTRFGFTKILMVEPLGLECVSAALRARSHETHLVDLRLEPPRALADRIAAAPPGVVGIACAFTTDVYTSLQTAAQVKRLRPHTPVVVGGHHASLVPGDFLFPGSPVDAVVVGEGEETAAELVDALERGDDPGVVPGVLTLETLTGGGFRARQLSRDLDALPLPDRELSRRYRRYYHHGFNCPSACVETSRGCPFDCNFCSIWVFYRRRPRRRSPDRIVEDLERVRALGEEHVFFTDDIAFLQRDAYAELAALIRQAGLRMDYSCETRADLVVRYCDLFREWSELGLRTVFLGIEKVDDHGLESVRKRTKGGALTNIEAIQILRACGITPMTSLIADPDWNEADFDRLEEFVRLLQLPNPTFTVLTPLPGTELWEARKHEVTTKDYAFFDVMHLVLPSRLSPDRFYARFARLYRLADARTRWWSVPALRTLGRLAARRQAFVARRVWSAVREMRSPDAYLRYPGSTTPPPFVPQEYGRASWVDRSRSDLARAIAPGS